MNNEQASGESATQNQDEDAPEQDKCGSDSESDIQYPQDTGASRKRFKRGSVSSESSDTIIIGDTNSDGESSDTMTVGHEEGANLINFLPTKSQWQREKSTIFGVSVKNVYECGRKRKITISAEPVKLVNMRGDGNCLFRAFSFVISGVQSYHRQIREKLVTFMEENACLLRG